LLTGDSGRGRRIWNCLQPNRIFAALDLPAAHLPNEHRYPFTAHPNIPIAEMLEKSIRSYQNRAIETAEVIKELIELAKGLKAAQAHGENLGLTEDEVAFYDALGTNDSAVKVLGEPTLKMIAKELVETVRRNVSIDWTVREGVRAKLRVMVKRVLSKYGYPPDKREKATQTVLEQAEAICKDWAA
jgi:type I restriction enzyme R subunit